MMTADLFRYAFAACLIVLPLTGCSKESTGQSTAVVGGLSATVHNYAQFSVVSVTVNGKWAGGGNSSVKLGEANSSGTVCCVSIDRSKSTVTVEIVPATGTSFRVEAPLMQPWPEVATYAIVHILPNRKALVEVVPSDWFEKPERLAALQKLADK